MIDNKILALAILAIIVIGVAVPMVMAKNENKTTETSRGDACMELCHATKFCNYGQCELNSSYKLCSETKGCKREPCEKGVADCDPGEKCICYSQATTTTSTTTTTIADSCDETDRGFNVLEQGTNYGYDNGVPYNHTDFCNGTEYLVEYFCYEGDCEISFFDCTFNFTSCYAGACVP